METPRPGTGIGDSDLRPMLRTKLRAPELPTFFIHRQRLHDLLDDIVTQPLTVVVAPAGSGKTLLIAGWTAQSPVPMAWLSLDDADRDPSQFWFELLAAIEQIAPCCTVAASDALRMARPTSEVVAHLLDGLDAAGRNECILVVDDIHLADDIAVAPSLATLIQHMPSWLHLVLLSRSDLNLPIDRWRGQGRVLEVRFGELRLSFDESCDMLARLVPNLAEPVLREVAIQTDGWAAGVQLSALAARASLARPGVCPPRLDSNSLIEDYVRHEVLKSADAEVVDLLLRISVVDRANGSLASALTDRADAVDLLTRAEAGGLFVVRLETEGGWFRIHPLVRTILLDELTRRSGHLDQHRRAALWFEEVDETSDALDQWLLAGEPREALRLLAANTARLYDLGRESVIRRTIAAIPHAATSAEVPALLSFAFSHVLVNRRIFVQVVDEAAWWAERSSIDDGTRAQLLMMQSMVASVLGDWQRTGPLARQAIAMLDRAGIDDPYGKFAWNAVARGEALLEQWSDESTDLRDAVLATSRDPERGLSLEGIRAVGEALAGRPVDALRIAAGVRHAAVTMSILRSELALAEAVARRELGDRVTSTLELEAIVATPSEPAMYCGVLAALELVAVRLEEGDLTGATECLAAARSLVADDNIGGDLRNLFRRAETLVALAEGAIDDAWTAADSIDDSFWGPVSRGRVLLERNELTDARDALACAEPRCPRHRVILGLLRARSDADSAEALTLAADAVILASSNLMLQTVASECCDSMELVERIAWCVPEEWMDRLRRAATHERATWPAHDPHQIEQLTQRERDVLRFLPSRLTLREIADELYVSVNTLKFHLRLIYRKLGVNSRDEAAALARAMTAVRTTTRR